MTRDRFIMLSAWPGITNSHLLDRPQITDWSGLASAAPLTGSLAHSSIFMRQGAASEVIVVSRYPFFTLLVQHFGRSYTDENEPFSLRVLLAHLSIFMRQDAASEVIALLLVKAPLSTVPEEAFELLTTMLPPGRNLWSITLPLFTFVLCWWVQVVESQDWELWD